MNPQGDIKETPNKNTRTDPTSPTRPPISDMVARIDVFSSLYDTLEIKDEGRIIKTVVRLSHVAGRVAGKGIWATELL
jgi:hypothetical protein